MTIDKELERINDNYKLGLITLEEAVILKENLMDKKSHSFQDVQDLAKEVMQPIEDSEEKCEHHFERLNNGDMQCEYCAKEIGPDGDGDND